MVELNNEENKEIYYKLTKRNFLLYDDLHKKQLKIRKVLKVFDDKEMETIIEFLQRSVDELKRRS